MIPILCGCAENNNSLLLNKKKMKKILTFRIYSFYIVWFKSEYSLFRASIYPLYGLGLLYPFKSKTLCYSIQTLLHRFPASFHVNPLTHISPRDADIQYYERILVASWALPSTFYDQYEYEPPDRTERLNFSNSQNLIASNFKFDSLSHR